MSKKRTDKLWYIHIIGHYTTIKKNKLLICSMTWLNLTNMLSKRNLISIHTTESDLYEVLEQTKTNLKCKKLQVEPFV